MGKHFAPNNLESQLRKAKGGMVVDIGRMIAMIGSTQERLLMLVGIVELSSRTISKRGSHIQRWFQVMAHPTGNAMSLGF